MVKIISTEREGSIRPHSASVKKNTKGSKSPTADKKSYKGLETRLVNRSGRSPRPPAGLPACLPPARVGRIAKLLDKLMPSRTPKRLDERVENVQAKQAADEEMHLLRMLDK